MKGEKSLIALKARARQLPEPLCGNCLLVLKDEERDLKAFPDDWEMIVQDAEEVVAAFEEELEELRI